LALMGKAARSGADADNPYFALLGFNAAQDIDPAAAGRQILANYESRSRGDAAEFAMTPQAASSAAALGAKPRRVSRNVLEFCAKQQLMAVECFVKARAPISTNSPKRIKVLVQRYQALMQQRGYHNPATPRPVSLILPLPNCSERVIWSGRVRSMI
jgi:hypothetical protein